MKTFPNALYGIPFDKLFVNRERELNFLAKLTAIPGSCTFICGSAGIGKTALLNVFALWYGKKFVGNWQRIDASKRDFQNRVLDIIRPSQAGRRLLIIDSAELIPENLLSEIEETVKNCNVDSLVISGRRFHQNPKRESKTIHLAGLSMRDMIQARLKYLPDAPGIDQVLRVIDGNALLFQTLLANPRRALNVANSIFEQGSAFQHSSVEVHSETTVTTQGASTDVVSIVLAIILFLISQFTIEKSNENILHKLNEVQVTISEQISTSDSGYYENPHLVTNFLNLRSEPKVKEENVITVLAPNQMVGVIEIQKGWARVTYKDSRSGKEVSGWVSSQYLTVFK